MGNEWLFMFRCIFLPGDLLWITASDTTHRHWEWLCAVNKSKIWQCFYFRFLKIYLVGSYLASGRPRLHQIALAEDRTNQAKCLHFPCLQVAAANLKCHNVLSHGQVNTERLQWGMQKWGIMGTRGKGLDTCDDSFVISFSPSKSICSYAFETHLRSRCNLGLS